MWKIDEASIRSVGWVSYETCFECYCVLAATKHLNVDLIHLNYSQFQ